MSKYPVTFHVYVLCAKMPFFTWCCIQIPFFQCVCCINPLNTDTVKQRNILETWLSIILLTGLHAGNSFVLLKMTCSPNIKQTLAETQEQTGHRLLPHEPNHPFNLLDFFSTILNTFRFQKFAYGPLVHAWTTSHFQKKEPVFCGPRE